MDINEFQFKDEVRNLISILQQFLPKKKELFLVEPFKPRYLSLKHIHEEAKNVYPNCFVGTKLYIVRQIMDKVKLVQNYQYGKSNDSFSCYSTLLRKEMERRTTDDLVIDTNGSATAIFQKPIGDGIEMKLTTKIKDYISSETELCFEKEKENSVGTLSFSMDDVDPTTLSIMTQYLYKIHPDLYCGSEISFKPLSYPPKPDLSLSTRYEKQSFVMSSTISNTGFQLCLYKQFDSTLRLASVLNESRRKGVPATISLGLHKNYNNGTEVKIFIDSQKCGGFTVQKDLLFEEQSKDERVVRVIWSTVIDRQRRVRFGFGFHLDF